ncbi:hypothetical protein [Mesorhizobium salmacidum]|uniref:Uncharacterized protein n=1 Tax=Mesorhizobium salmacidum TaxID=3015171 RepID=A0ABU8L0M0_9HYPH
MKQPLQNKLCGAARRAGHRQIMLAKTRRAIAAQKGHIAGGQSVEVEHAGYFIEAAGRPVEFAIIRRALEIAVAESRQRQQEILSGAGEPLEEGILAIDARIIVTVPAIGTGIVDGQGRYIATIKADVDTIRAKQHACRRAEAGRQVFGRCRQGRGGHATAPASKPVERKIRLHPRPD